MFQIHTLASGKPSAYYPVGSDCVLYHTYWDGTAQDHSGYGNHGTASGGSFGAQGITLNGTTDFISITPAASMNPGTGDLTFAAWVNADTAIQDYARLAYWGLAGAGLATLLIYKNLSSWTATLAYDGGNYYNYPASPLQKTDWVFQAYCIKRADPNHGGYFRLNGVNQEGPIGTSTAANLSYSGFAYIGKGPDGYQVKGTIGEVYYFKSFKTEAQLASIYNSTKARYGL
jgi:hypothetical protein